MKSIEPVDQEHKNVEQLAALLRDRNEISHRITEIIGRPAQIGHIGEWIASQVFDIELESSAVAKGIDGRFRSGPLAGKTVNIKFYAKREGLLAIREDALPDYYLVLTGPRSTAMTSRDEARPWHIDSVYLFNTIELCDVILKKEGAKLDPCATSVRSALWDLAEIYPAVTNGTIVLGDRHRQLLKLFSSKC